MTLPDLRERLRLYELVDAGPVFEVDAPAPKSSASSAGWCVERTTTPGYT
jgi:hypothetical protein